MAAKNPPDGIVVTSGTWGTDIVQDTSTWLTNGTSIKLTGSSAVTYKHIKIPIMGNASLRTDASTDACDLDGCTVTVTFRANNATATISIKAYVLNASGAVIATNTIHNAVAPQTGVWLTKGVWTPTISAGAFVVVEISKSAASTDVYIDSIKVTRGVTYAKYYNSSASTSVSTSTWTKLALVQSSATYNDQYGVILSETNDNFKIVVPGVYSVYARTEVAPTEVFNSTIRLTIAGSASGSFSGDSTCTIYTGSAANINYIRRTFRFATNDTVAVDYYHNKGSSQSIANLEVVIARQGSEIY